MMAKKGDVMVRWLWTLILLPILGFSSSLSALYSTLDPQSVAQHLAFYELYPKTEEGQKALRHAWGLLSHGCADCDPEILLPTLDVQPMISLVNQGPEGLAKLELDDAMLQVVEKLGAHLGNRKLKGFNVWEEKALAALPAEELDLGHTLLLAELGPSEEAHKTIQRYNAHLDLMALQIGARLPENPTPHQKIRAISDYVFHEMRFRFPPHSLHAKEIDLYTFLPSVIDGRRGVCLGVSILYLCLAQRLELPLEAITPPGHIYVRYKQEGEPEINIETTARGIDVDSEHYLGLETRSLQKRNLREVIGLAFMNQAAVHWHKDDPSTAIALYEKARPFMKEDDFLLHLFLGFQYLFVGREQEGRNLLSRIRGVIPDHAITSETIVEDYLSGATDIEGVRAVFADVDETRESILTKQQRLKETLQSHPKFRQGVFHLAITWLQLGREKEALPILQEYLKLSPGDPTAHYYIASIQFQRHDFNAAWRALQQAEVITAGRNHEPHALKMLRKSLVRLCPEPAKKKKKDPL